MKYVINSSGKVIQLSSNQSEVRFVSPNIRKHELDIFAKQFIGFLGSGGINTADTGYAYMIQPFGIMERFLFFTKTEYSSSSKAVKLANDIQSHPDIMADRSKKNYLQSIVSDDTKGLRQYFLLCIGYLTIERNAYDGKPINIKYTLPVPLMQFTEMLKKQLITQDDNDKKEACPRYIIYFDDIDLNNPKELLNKAVARDVRPDGSDFDNNIVRFIHQYKQANHYEERDETSNQATFCLLSINNFKGNAYNEYILVKNCLKKTFKDVYNIRYEKNRITANFQSGNTLTIYVKSTGNNPQYIIGGKTINGLSELKDFFAKGDLFSEAQWFSKNVSSYIQINSAKKVSSILKGKDELNWLSKPHKKKGTKNEKHEKKPNSISK